MRTFPILQAFAYFTLKLALRLCRLSGLHNPRGLALDAAGDIKWTAPNAQTHPAPNPDIPLVALGPDSLDTLPSSAPASIPDARTNAATPDIPNPQVSFNFNKESQLVWATINWDGKNWDNWKEQVFDSCPHSIRKARNQLLADIRSYCDRDARIIILEDLDTSLLR